MNSVNYAKEFKKANHAVGINEHHLEFCPKYRYKCMKKPHIKQEIERLILQTASEHKIFVITIATAEDHVHMDVALPFDMSPAEAEMKIKGRSAYLIFRRFPNFRLRYPRGHFWAPGKFSRSMSGVTADTVRNYIKNQQTGKLHDTIVQAEEEIRQLNLTNFF